MDLTQHFRDDSALTGILTLIRTCFAEMEGKIDPPSSMHRLTLQTLQTQTQAGEIWSLGPPLSACVFLSPKYETLYIGKLCVAPRSRGQGLARSLITHAAGRAKALGLNCLELQTRVELTNNHATFRAMGFTESGRTAHAGYTSATSITFRKTL